MITYLSFHVTLGFLEINVRILTQYVSISHALTVAYCYQSCYRKSGHDHLPASK